MYFITFIDSIPLLVLTLDDGVTLIPDDTDNVGDTIVIDISDYDTHNASLLQGIY